MRNRLLLTVAAVSAGLAMLPVAPAAVHAVDQVTPVESQARSMADRSNPRLTGVPEILDGYAYLHWEGLAADAVISSVSVVDERYGASVSGSAGDLNLSFSEPDEPYISVYGANSENGVVGGEFQLVVVYADGSVDRVAQAISTRPAKQKDAYEPYLDDGAFTVDEPATRELRSLPDGARITVVFSPANWDVEVVGPRSLRVVAHEELEVWDTRTGISLAVAYPDGTSETVRLMVSAETRSIEPAPRPTSTGSPIVTTETRVVTTTVPVEEETGKPRFDKTELDFRSGRVETLRIIGIDPASVDHIEILDQNGWPYRRGQVGILHFRESSSNYRQEDKTAFRVWAETQESPETIDMTVVARVVYTDGGTRDVESKMRITPPFVPRCDSPELDFSSVEPGERSTVTLTGLPAGWPVSIQEVSRGSAARVTADGNLEVIVPKEAHDLRISLQYPCTGDPAQEVGLEEYWSTPWTFVSVSTETFTTTNTPPATVETSVETETVIKTTTTPAAARTTVTTAVPTTVISTVNGTPVTVTNTEKVTVTNTEKVTVNNTEKTVVVQTAEASRVNKVLPIVAAVLSLIAALGGIFATALNIPELRALMPF